MEYNASKVADYQPHNMRKWGVIMGKHRISLANVKLPFMRYILFLTNEALSTEQRQYNLKERDTETYNVGNYLRLLIEANNDVNYESPRL